MVAKTVLTLFRRKSFILYKTFSSSRRTILQQILRQRVYEIMLPVCWRSECNLYFKKGNILRVFSRKYGVMTWQTENFVLEKYMHKVRIVHVDTKNMNCGFTRIRLHNLKSSKLGERLAFSRIWTKIYRPRLRSSYRVKSALLLIL